MRSVLTTRLRYCVTPIVLLERLDCYCDVLDCRDANAKAHAIDLGIGMQLTNIARDVLEMPGWVGAICLARGSMICHQRRSCRGG